MIEVLNSAGNEAVHELRRSAVAGVKGRPVSVVSPDGAHLDYIAYFPEAAGPDAPLLVCLHGLKRNPAEQIFRFAPYADRNKVVLLAPFFSRSRFKRFQTLQPDASGALPEEMFDDTLADFADRFRISPARLWFFGFSGGGQFAHRYCMLGRRRPDRLAIVSPGWFTIPDPDLPYPVGTGPSEKLSGRILDPGLLLDIPSLVMVGSRDTKRGPSLNRDPMIDKYQGRTRLERAQNWIGHMQSLSRKQKKICAWEFVTVKGAKHSFSRMIDQYELGDMLFNWFAKEPDYQGMR